MLVVAARFTARAGEGEKVAAVCRGFAERVKDNETEMVTYTCSRSTDQPSRFLSFERCASTEAYRRHASSPAFVEFLATIQGLIDGPIEVHTYEEIAVAD